MSNLGLWEPTYQSRDPFPYGNENSYRLGAEFLKGCRTIEDWGCGTQWFRRVMKDVEPSARVIGLDGSAGHCDRVVELAEYRPADRPDGVFMRHVLEHDYNWRAILASALQSFTQRMVLVCFTPFSNQETLLLDYEFPTGGSCPYLSLRRQDIEDLLKQHSLNYRMECIPSPGTEYGQETVFRIDRCVRGSSQNEDTDSERPFVSCLCPTYRRPQLLANSVACFLAQDYPESRRELLILDDAGQYESHGEAGWEVIALPRRFRSLPEKFNALAGLAQGEILIVWEDDDVYLPWHVSTHVRAMANGRAFSKPSRIRSHYAGKIHEEGASGRFHGSIAFTRAAFDSVGGWPLTKRGDFDQQFMSRLAGLGEIADPIDFNDPSYIFRWEATGAYHGQGLMHGAADTDWYQRAAQLGTPAVQPRVVPQLDPMAAEWVTR